MLHGELVSAKLGKASTDCHAKQRNVTALPCNNNQAPLGPCRVYASHLPALLIMASRTCSLLGQVKNDNNGLSSMSNLKTVVQLCSPLDICLNTVG